MNKTGQIGVGTLMMTAIAIIVGVVFLAGAIAPQISQMSNTYSVSNNKINFTVGTNNPVVLVGKGITGFTAYNSSDSTATVDAAAYTLTDNVLQSDGTLKATLLKKSSGWNSSFVNISYTYQPAEYVDSQAGRTILDLVIVLAGLSILLVAVSPLARDKLLSMIGK